jgi:hypothetical protein
VVECTGHAGFTSSRRRREPPTPCGVLLMRCAWASSKQRAT